MTTNQEGIVPKIHTHTSAEGGIFANAYIIETQNGLVAVDATLTVSESKSLKNLIDSINKPLLAILLTHPHPDHVAGVTNLLVGSSSSNNIPIVALESVEKRMEKHEAIMKARDLFNDEKYWGAHEVLESVWKDAHHEEKDLLNGIILIAAAFVHDEKDETSICIAILSRAMKKLSQAEGLYFGMNLDEIKKQVLRIIETGKIERFTI